MIIDDDDACSRVFGQMQTALTFHYASTCEIKPNVVATLGYLRNMLGQPPSLLVGPLMGDDGIEEEFLRSTVVINSIPW
jgi:hypothetical protein